VAWRLTISTLLPLMIRSAHRDPGDIMFKRIRITLLLFLLILVGVGAVLQQQRLTDWEEPLWIAVYPIAGDSSDSTRAYLQRLDVGHFAMIETFMVDQAREYKKRLARPVKLALGPRLDALPPAPPENGSLIAVMAWSLRLRYWAWQHESPDQLADVSLYLVYHDPRESPRIPHSLGMKEGRIGVVHAFAVNDMTQSNNVIITHEFLHVLGATDKYDPRNDLPIHPAGYADPRLEPLHPQSRAEIMGGRIPLSPVRAAIPDGLHQVVIGPETAAEIGW
jgi:hypothetical protein